MHLSMSSESEFIFFLKEISQRAKSSDQSTCTPLGRGCRHSALLPGTAQDWGLHHHVVLYHMPGTMQKLLQCLYTSAFSTA